MVSATMTGARNGVMASQQKVTGQGKGEDFGLHLTDSFGEAHGFCRNRGTFMSCVC